MSALQVSSRTRDFLVDTIALRTEIGPALGPLFADSEVCLRFIR